MRRIALILGLFVSGFAVFGYSGLYSPGSPAEAQTVAFEIGVVGPPFQWAPANVTMPVGTTVEWTATGPAPHTVTSEGCLDSRIGPCTFDSGAAPTQFLRAGTARTSFEYTFNEPGVYPFMCRLHGQIGGGGQFGVIVVYEPGAGMPSGNYFAPAELVARIEAEKAAAATPAAGGSVTPPSTGDGGLQAGGESYLLQAGLVLVAVTSAWRVVRAVRRS